MDNIAFKERLATSILLKVNLDFRYCIGCFCSDTKGFYIAREHKFGLSLGKVRINTHNFEKEWKPECPFGIVSYQKKKYSDYILQARHHSI